MFISQYLPSAPDLQYIHEQQNTVNDKSLGIQLIFPCSKTGKQA